MLAELLLAAAVTQPVTAEFCQMNMRKVEVLLRGGVEAEDSLYANCDFVNNGEAPVLIVYYTVELREPGRRVAWIEASGSVLFTETIAPNEAANKQLHFFDKVVNTPAPADLSNVEVVLNVTRAQFAN